MASPVLFASPPRIVNDVTVVPNSATRVDIAGQYGVPAGADAAILKLSLVGTDSQPGRAVIIQYHNSTTADNALGHTTQSASGWADAETGFVKLNYEGGLPGSVFICCPSWVGSNVRVWLDLQGYTI